jgi:hypothetical protein
LPSLPWLSPSSPSLPPERAAEPVRGYGPEITISIGHIEVRSAPPPAAEPRPRPRFRPQVTLDDFLSQDRRP